MKKFLTAWLLLGFIGTGIVPANAAIMNFFPDEEQKDDEEGPKVINPYDDKYKPDIATGAENGQGSIVPNYIFYATLVREPGASPDDLNLLVVSPGSVTGCLDIENPTMETVKTGNTLRLKMTEGRIGVDTGTVRYFQYECSPKTNASEMRITLSKQQLLNDHIEKLILVSPAIGDFNDMLLDFQDHALTVTSKMHDLSALGIPLKGSTSTMTYWDYPENTMVLLSSGADLRDPETMASVRKLARRKGLTPLDEIIPEFNPGYSLSDKLFVVDTNGLYKQQLSAPTDSLMLGTIQTTETYFGPKGPYPKPVEKSVYARMPGTQE